MLRLPPHRGRVTPGSLHRNSGRTSRHPRRYVRIFDMLPFAFPPFSSCKAELSPSSDVAGEGPGDDPHPRRRPLLATSGDGYRACRALLSPFTRLFAPIPRPPPRHREKGKALSSRPSPHVLGRGAAGGGEGRYKPPSRCPSPGVAGGRGQGMRDGYRQG